MSALSELADLKPTRRLLIMDLLKEAGVDVRPWSKVRNVPASANPKYCYNWSFEQPGEFVAVCLWYSSLRVSADKITCSQIARSKRAPRTSQEVVWAMRRAEFDKHIQLAYLQQLPLRVIVVDGKQGDPKAANPKASRVAARLLDPVAWAITECNLATGECVLVRGEKPSNPASSSADIELSWFEGSSKRAFVNHRRREARARREKINEALRQNEGKLICEVPSCGFDFKARYGILGDGYAQVHHLELLSKSPKKGREVKLRDLAIVCANCHAMIHLGGECRPLEGLITAENSL